jgi:hypothetical protein
VKNFSDLARQCNEFFRKCPTDQPQPLRFTGRAGKTRHDLTFEHAAAGLRHSRAPETKSKPIRRVDGMAFGLKTCFVKKA